MELIRNWITSVTAASILISAALAVTPKGSAKKVVRLVGGLILFIVLTAPLKEIDYTDFAYFNMQYRAEYENYEEKLITENSTMIKSIIEDKTRTYILQKADELGIECDAEVFAASRDDGYPYPDKVVIKPEGTPDPALREKLSYVIESELGVTADRQEWRQTEDE
jgi:hypothetical protein